VTLEGLVAWWENNGSGNFTTHIIASNYDDAISVYVKDLDSDGDMDLLTASVDLGLVSWWENDGNENFTYHLIANNLPLAHCVHSTDLDGDGDNDVLVAVRILNLIIWYENDGFENFTPHNVYNYIPSPFFVTTADMDNDNDIDVLGVCYWSDMIAGWENNGNQIFTQHIIPRYFDGPYFLRAVDIDSDGDQDILSTATDGNMIAWAENLGGWNFQYRVICSSPRFNEPLDACAVDFDLDDELDLVAIAYTSNDIAWWRNDGNQNFTPFPIFGHYNAPHRIQTGDMDGDGDQDFVVNSHINFTLDWWENTLIDTNYECPENTFSDLAEIKQSCQFQFSVSPNPFNAQTEITFTLAEPCEVSLVIYDSQGREIESIVNGQWSSGEHRVVWNAKNYSSGIYFVSLQAGGFNQTKKLLLVK
jgi:hypothetical protein